MATFVLSNQKLFTDIPTKKIVFAIVVFISIILIWVGIFLILGFAIWSDTNNKRDVGAGIITLIIGASILGVGSVINKKTNKSKV